MTRTRLVVRVVVRAIGLLAATAGCAGFGLEGGRSSCALIGGLLGGVAGAVVAHNGDEHETDEELAGGGIGAAAGAALGALICGDSAQGAAQAPAPTLAPSARIDARPLEGEAPLRVALAADVSPQTNVPRTYRWDLGDGSSGEGERATHTYTAPGSYTVRLTVSSAGSQPLVASTRVLVRERDRDMREEPAPPQAPRRIVLRGVRFATGSAVISVQDEALLEVAVEQLRENPDVRVQITGHTDSRGTDSFNQDLSERRANAVLDYLAGNGIARARLSARGRGESEPQASNDTDAGRAENRRVELDILE